MIESQYNRTAAARYAAKWALSRNPAYYNFDKIGGDCTNYASQCIYAGSGVMNYTPVMGWFYSSLNKRTPSWTGVQFLYNFLIQNRSVGPYAVLIEKKDVQPGDIVQLGDASGRYYHSPVVLSNENGEILVAAHTLDVVYHPLSSYVYDRARFLHIKGVRVHG